ncbi:MULTISPECIES: type I restriction endonuclease subunit R [Bacillus cereus group]|uniref:Type I restriction enzyme endonuclease subunit n=1 Tax=Bacillus cereus TaxID=1396 RepID=A0A9W7UZA7_BACCE|nr:type I restriction endonuclease subunit R [Bacillus cereus]KAB2400090.1 type I restriction endonuclease subunit R [Bacillus cereus]KAB2410482.1 type I restriction endonuclease subunit R [Bacillus cereus]KAB2427724.1 type I restriction endonuclease subunit R [Bacillus cereus]
MTYQSEAQLEKNMIEQLVHQGYKPITINNYDALIHNFRNQLNNFNKKKLDGRPLTDSEFSRFLTQIDGKSIFETAKILRDKQVFQRDDGTEIYLELFNKREWCKNFFQVTHQTTVEGKYKNRYDVTILINGLPVIQVELKRRGLDFKEAFNQIQRYRKHSFRGLYRFLQLFVVSNGVDTKYFANSDGDMLFGYTFYWSDAENNRITTLNEFTESFLEKCHMAKMIARYMILNDTEKKLMVMRPYQVFAVEALLKRALETKNNGYIWHTTGSGKTLTSFKASQLLSNEPSIKKVFFLVDRKDLDSQTSEEFNKFEPDSVDETDKTDNLVQQIADMTKPLILTTIQKMANAVKNKKYEEVMAQYRNERVIFIIDECHRSQFGDMHKEISKHFQQAQYFGFTGTPRFEKNKSQDGRVTADLFEKCLHTYLIKDAIQDGNVLGFSVEYIKTMDIEFYEEDKSRVKGIETDEIWMHDDRLELIAQNIIDNHERRAKSKGYTAIFTVQNIPMLVKYYDIFKKLDHNLKITGIFTYGANEDSESRDEHSRDALERIITDYNKQFGKNFSTDKFQGYFKDVSKGVKTAQIDILLVVEMFLTGFDSKKLNTLYVDRNLKYHGLVQAYSRTNRVDKATKPYGNIVCFRNLKENTDEAIRLFSETDSVNDVLMKSYEDYLNQFKAALANVYALADSPASVDQLEREEDKHDFIVSFRELTKNLVSLQTFTDFEFDAEELGIEEQTYQDYKSKYLRIYDETKKKDGKESILANVDFSIELMHTDRINVSYIMNLIRNINFDDEEEREKTIKTIEDELNRADNEELRLKVDLIKSFLRKVVPTMTSADSVDDTYNEFEQEERVKEIEVFAKEFNVSKEMLQSFIEEYEYSGIIKNQEISDNIKLPLLKKKKLLQRIISFISEHTKRFS